MNIPIYSQLFIDWCAAQTVQIKNKSRNEIFIPNYKTTNFQIGC